MNVFTSADILLPKNADMHKWAVIACDQFTSDPAYWARVRETAADAPSTYNLVLPEVELGTENEATRTQAINQTMQQYLNDGVFTVYPNSYIYVERTLANGVIRKGLVGKIDLEAYDFHVGAESQIRATEKTVLERIPPRVKVRRDASIELPHVIMLCDDHEKQLIEPITARKADFQQLYDFDLMEDGGHITGWLVSPEESAAFDQRLTAYSATVDEKYAGLVGTPMVMAVGDGNHSLATAKTCYEELKAANPNADLSNHPARYALVELENLHDVAQQFEPIHRVITGCDPQALLAALKEAVCLHDDPAQTSADALADKGFAVRWYAGKDEGTVYLDKAKGQLAVGILQSWLDDYLPAHDGEIDYIHDDEALIDLARQENAIGFLLPAMEKDQLFRGVIADGALPRKTFSMGHSREKRYYLEGRKIR